MKPPFPRTLLRRLRFPAFLVALLASVSRLQAAQTIFPGRAHSQLLAAYIAAVLVLEAVTAAWLLRQFRHPRLFAAWILGTHLLTFPVFWGTVWLLQALFRDFTIALAMGLVVLAEGWLVSQICRRAPSPTYLAPPSVVECWYAALIANACSLLAFWLLLVPVYSLFA